MKHVFEREAMQNTQYLVQLILFQLGCKILDDDYLTTVLKYYVGNAQTADPVKFQKILEEGLAKKGEVMATLESYFAQKGRASLLMDMLKVKFNDLSDAYIEKINRADANTLSQWGINLMKAQSLDEVFR